MQPQIIMTPPDDYEYTWPIMYGGGVGNYRLESPFNGPSELAVLSFYPTAAGSCTAYLSPSKNLPTDTSAIAATGIAGTQGTPGIYFDGSATPGIGFGPLFWPVDGACTLRVDNGSALICCVWRRRRKPTQSAGNRYAKAFDEEAVTNG